MKKGTSFLFVCSVVSLSLSLHLSWTLLLLNLLPISFSCSHNRQLRWGATKGACGNRTASGEFLWSVLLCAWGALLDSFSPAFSASPCGSLFSFSRSKGNARSSGGLVYGESDQWLLKRIGFRNWLLFVFFSCSCDSVGKLRAEVVPIEYVASLRSVKLILLIASLLLPCLLCAIGPLLSFSCSSCSSSLSSII